jgi:hypothetical protein
MVRRSLLAEASVAYASLVRDVNTATRQPGGRANFCLVASDNNLTIQPLILYIAVEPRSQNIFAPSHKLNFGFPPSSFNSYIYPHYAL